VGKTYLYQFNHDNYVAKELLHPLFKKEERLLKVISRLLRDEFSEKVKEEIISIALFGSVEKREDRPDSDIDLLVLVTRAKDKEKIEKAFDNFNEKITRLFGKIVSPYIESASGFRRKYRQGLPVVIEIVQSHKLISGKSLREVI
jgi:predicted nucleotidyltransferase